MPARADVCGRCAGDSGCGSHETGKTSGEFTAIHGMTGELAAVPLRLVYQPRWWLRTELVVDDATSFSALRR